MNKYKKIIAVAFVLSVSLILNIANAASWTPPKNVPPLDNTPAPINVSNIPQHKDGAFSSFGVISAFQNPQTTQPNRITAPKFCLNGDGKETNCVQSWAQVVGGSGDVKAGPGQTINFLTKWIDSGSKIITNSSFYEDATKGLCKGMGASQVCFGNGTPGLTGPKGIMGSDGTVLSCTITNQVLKWDGTGWKCGTASGTGGITSISSGGAGITINTNNTTGAVTITNTGVTSIKAGAGIKVDPVAGTGAVTITNIGGGAGGGLSGNGTAGTIPVFATATSLSDSPITAITPSGSTDTMRVNIFPTNIWGASLYTQTNIDSKSVNISGKVKITSGNPGTNKILASDTVGVASWKTASELGLGGVTNLTSYTQLPSGSIAGFCNLYGAIGSLSLPPLSERLFIAPAMEGFSFDIKGITNPCTCASGWKSIVHVNELTGSGAGNRSWSSCIKM
ncbi:MAG: Outer membrane autotransporter barrel-like protein [Parcubacteria group bacterium GW2011_GWF2_38_76]|nr:MAG: Outer membrane autotransporter barrel-like protein [Parcubacteria group bacterium GW2011_GWF2_38_76]HBM45477.1 hypothetical protein [Patescibacteria group bacterium]